MSNMSENNLLNGNNGHFNMDDSSSKPEAQQSAKAEGKIYFSNGAREILLADNNPKADVITAAKVAGIQAAKRTSEFIPFHHANSLNWVELDFSSSEDHIKIESTVKAVTRSGLEMEALTAVSVAALTILDICKDHDQQVNIQDIKIVPKVSKKKMLTVKTPLKVGVLVISDRITAGLADDEVGQMLQSGFAKAGYHANNYSIISNDADKLIEKVQEWLEQNIELIITTGGNGIGPRDITLTSLEPFFDFRMEGLEQTLHSIAQVNNNGFYIDRLAAGKIGKTIVICLPIDNALAQDALNVILPNIHQAFEF
ncbi:MAG: bifunctional molybdenum cofactor biosynthesis protein MoaC/MoaB [Calditrichaeota bacterium]|nr:MAG: bifunctional molybdenum cofactor biosynthesis protein MoaC/MoaB [Calditrichota bacterium]MBL1205060.1 bifunctional molybdenum cofactor biosynthesis protein MoaC/MoaB [Calditrichota bacterium]